MFIREGMRVLMENRGRERGGRDSDIWGCLGESGWAVLYLLNAEKRISCSSPVFPMASIEGARKISRDLKQQICR